MHEGVVAFLALYSLLIDRPFTVMIFYDIMITFGDEVERIWKRRFTGATALWFLVCPWSCY